MFFLKTPLRALAKACNADSSRADRIETLGQYSTLDEAIDAAIKSDLNLATAIIEKKGCQHPVNDWISFRIAGGNHSAG